jgi:formate/nitrite transporter FocA (FNT family)
MSRPESKADDLHRRGPVLLGNIIGGTALFALIAYAQVMKEI